MDEKAQQPFVERSFGLPAAGARDPGRTDLAFRPAEMSRQRIRASVLESSTEPARNAVARPCALGSLVALQLLRGLE